MASRVPLVIGSAGRPQQLQSGDFLPSAALPDIVTGVTVGDATHIPIVTYDNKGRVTGTSTAAISAGGVDAPFAFFLS